MSITLNGRDYRVVRMNGKPVVIVDTGRGWLSRLATPVEIAQPAIALLVMAGLTTPAVV